MEEVLDYELILGDYPLPPPELLGDSCFEPITTPQALLEESAELKHCAFSTMRKKLRDGRCWLFKAKLAQRGTVEVVSNDGIYVAEQFKLESNAEPDDPSTRVLEEWLDAANHTKTRRSG